VRSEEVIDVLGEVEVDIDIGGVVVDVGVVEEGVEVPLEGLPLGTSKAISYYQVPISNYIYFFFIINFFFNFKSLIVKSSNSNSIFLKLLRKSC